MIAGNMKKKPLTISMMGRRGGLSRSSAKSEAARRNGLKGGRPAVKVNGHRVKDEDPEDLPI